MTSRPPIWIGFTGGRGMPVHLIHEAVTPKSLECLFDPGLLYAH
jgi:hypothetical protein